MEFVGDALWPLILLAAVVVFVGAVVPLFRGSSGGASPPEKEPYRYTRKKYFLTKAEHEFYDALVAAVGSEYRIFAQVHLPTIVDHAVKGQSWKGALAHIQKKSVDFVLCDTVDISPKLAIELDDKSHERPERQARDQQVKRILEQAGVPLVRIQNTGRFDQAELKRQIEEGVSS